MKKFLEMNWIQLFNYLFNIYMIFNYIDGYYFMISLCIGIFFVYILSYQPQIIIRFPTPDNNLIYKDSYYGI